jgi:hypothetical protein
MLLRWRSIYWPGTQSGTQIVGLKPALARLLVELLL